MQGEVKKIIDKIFRYYNQEYIYGLVSKFLNSTLETANNNSAIIENGQMISSYFLKPGRNQRIKLVVNAKYSDRPIYYEYLQYIGKVDSVYLYYGGINPILISKGSQNYEIEIIVSTHPKKTIDFFVENNLFTIADSYNITRDFSLSIVENIKGKYSDDIQSHIQTYGGMIEVRKSIKFKYTNDPIMFLGVLSDSFIDYYGLYDELCEALRESEVLCRDIGLLGDYYEAMVYVNAFMGYNILLSNKKMAELYCNSKEPKMLRAEYIPVSQTIIDIRYMINIVSYLEDYHNLSIEKYYDPYNDYIDYEDSESIEEFKENSKFYQYSNAILSTKGISSIIKKNIPDIFDVVSRVYDIGGVKYHVFIAIYDDINEFKIIQEINKLMTRFIFNLVLFNNVEDDINSIIRNNIKFIKSYGVVIRIYTTIDSDEKNSVIENYTKLLNGKYTKKFINVVDFTDMYTILSKMNNVRKIIDFKIYVIDENGTNKRFDIKGLNTITYEYYALDRYQPERRYISEIDVSQSIKHVSKIEVIS